MIPQASLFYDTAEGYSTVYKLLYYLSLDDMIR